MQIRVYYEDTDAGGIVYHSNYLKFCERARSEFFFARNMLPIIDGAHFVVRKMDCDFISSAKFADILDVTTILIEMKKASFTILQEIKKDDKILFSAKVLLVLAKDGKVKRIDKKIEDILKSLFVKIDIN